LIAGKTIEEWKRERPMIRQMIDYKELFWENNRHLPFERAKQAITITEKDIDEAEAVLKRFAPYISKVFPETSQNKGLIESPLKRIERMKKILEKESGSEIPGKLLLKCDSHLPISGSIKARGGIFEVLKHAEDIATKNGLLTKDDDYSILATDRFKTFFSQHKLSVGSTGNLGLSIGIMGAKLGFRVTVHMSADARQWKKEMLRNKGVDVIEYDSDYSRAVVEGRKMAESEQNNHFVDDENSINLFLGYAVAGRRLQKQLDDMNLIVDREHPLFVYLPCGVGGGPGGVAFGLKMIYGDNVHIFFAEPTHSPCMMLGMVTEKHDEVSVQDFGIDNITAADGLAVGRASSFIGKTLEHTIDAFFTISDEKLFRCLKWMWDSEDIHLEPSALAGVASVLNFFETGRIHEYKSNQKIRSDNILHIAWATGGNMVPKKILKKYYQG
jgi:D-serine dehydratase